MAFQKTYLGATQIIVLALYDVVALIQCNRLDVRSAEFRELVEKYGDAELYEKIVHACG